MVKKRGPKIILLVILLSLLNVLVNSQQDYEMRQQSSVYIVKFYKATPEEIKKSSQSSQLLSEIQFLQKLVKNTSEVLKQAFFYVNYTLQIPILNLSNFNNYTNSTESTITNSNLRTNSPVLTNSISTNREVQKQNISQLITLSKKENDKLPSSLNVSKSSTKSQFSSTQLSPTAIPSSSPSSEVPLPAATAPYSHIQSVSLKQSPYQSKVAPLALPLPIFLPSPLDMEFASGGIGLVSELPKNFNKNQVYRFNGTIIDKSVIQSLQSTYVTDQVFLTFTVNRIEGEDQVKCFQKVYKNKLWFSISCQLEIQGPVFFGVSIGKLPGFSSKIIRKIYENSSPLSFSPIMPAQPQGLYLSITDGDLFINWQSKAAVTKISFLQPSTNQSVQFILSNWQNSFRVPHHAFSNFQEQLTIVYISHANSRDRTLYGLSTNFGNIMYIKFKAAQHLTIKNHIESYRFFNDLPMRVQPNRTYSVNVTFGVRVQNQFFMVSPFNQIKKGYFKSQLRKKGTSGVAAGLIDTGEIITLKFFFDKVGTNLLEINEDSGLAIINQPIYVGEIYPLLPDYVDIKLNAVAHKKKPIPLLQSYFLSTHPRKITISEPDFQSPISEKRAYLFTLLNLLRTRQIVNPVYLDEKLTYLAQNHSTDMKKNSFFSHKSPNGEGPGQRAKKSKFFGAIGENVALSQSLIEAHLSLERSATHLQNSLNYVWTRVGIGIEMNQFGQYLITFQFSSRDIELQPLTKSQLQAHQSQLSNLALSILPSEMAQNRLASLYILEWLESPRIYELTNYIYVRGIRQQMFVTSITFAYYPKIVSEIEKSADFFRNVTEASNKKKIGSFGVNLAVTRYDPTLIQCYFVYFYK